MNYMNEYKNWKESPYLTPGQKAELEGIDVVASGGITYYHEIETLAKMNISGAILGKALYTGALDIEKALEIVKE